jgi:hypothetical protein
MTTSVSYPNGTSVVVRIDQHGDRFLVSDDGYASVIAETAHVLVTFNKVASLVAERTGISFERGSFFVRDVACESLLGAVVAVANASAKAADRTMIAVEQSRVRRSREVFDRKLTEAFGHRAIFNITFRGATGREWEFDAGVSGEYAGTYSRLFEFVTPAFSAVAAANMKIGDARGLSEAPAITAALADYERTEPTLRAILSATADNVIAANDPVSRYLAPPIPVQASH